MRRLNVGANLAVFVLFFGMALLDAFQSHNWVKTVFWLAIAALFLFAAGVRKDDPNRI